MRHMEKICLFLVMQSILTKATRLLQFFLVFFTIPNNHPAPQGNQTPNFIFPPTT